MSIFSGAAASKRGRREEAMKFVEEYMFSTKYIQWGPKIRDFPQSQAHHNSESGSEWCKSQLQYEASETSESSSSESAFHTGLTIIIMGINIINSYCQCEAYQREELENFTHPCAG